MSKFLITKDTRSTPAKARHEPTIALVMTPRETRLLIACLENCKPNNFLLAQSDQTGKLLRFAAKEARLLRETLEAMKS